MHNNVEIAPSSYKFNTEAKGHVKIWQFNKATGDKKLLVSQDNLVLKTGADIMAAAITGAANSNITHYYVGYSIPADNPAAVSITTDSTRSTVFPTSVSRGYLRIPLAFNPSFLQETGYTANVPYFTAFITNGGSYDSFGADFVDGAKLYTLGLVNAQNPSGSNQDRIFSAINFGPITYDASNGLAITWGITFRAV